jgi:hypothetical protein
VTAGVKAGDGWETTQYRPLESVSKGVAMSP